MLLLLIVAVAANGVGLSELAVPPATSNTSMIVAVGDIPENLLELAIGIW